MEIPPTPSLVIYQVICSHLLCWNPLILLLIEIQPLLSKSLYTTFSSVDCKFLFFFLHNFSMMGKGNISSHNYREMQWYKPNLPCLSLVTYILKYLMWVKRYVHYIHKYFFSLWHCIMRLKGWKLNFLISKELLMRF